MTDQPTGAWTLLSSTYSYRDQWLTLRSDTVELPNGQTLSPYHVVELPEWVNVIAITGEGNIVLVEQYRHAVRQALLELPAGHVDPGETADAAIRRELLEETGYESTRWHDLGELFPAASRLTNKVRSYLALDARQVRAPQTDSSESIRLHSIPWADFVAALRSGHMKLCESNQFAAVLLLHMLAQSSADPAIARLRV